MIGKILVADDEPHMVYLLRMILKSEGFSVSGCQHGPKVLEMVKLEKPNLLILDIMMPETDGWQICRALRSDPLTRDLPIIVLSAVPFGEEERQKVREFQVYDYMTKPFEPIQLVGKVKNLLGAPASLRHLIQEGFHDAKIKRGMTTHKVDVLVFGGGFAGIAAAESAARGGAHVMLVEPSGFLGFEAVALNQVVWPSDNGSLSSQRFIKLAQKQGACRRSPRLRGDIFDPEGIRAVIREFLANDRLAVRLSAFVFDVMRDGNRVKGAILDSALGPERIESDVSVDCTLRGRLAELSGIPLVEEKLPPKVNLLLGGVDGDALEAGPFPPAEFSIHALPSMRDAVVVDYPLGNQGEKRLYSDMDKILDEIRGRWPGCGGAYLRARPLFVPTVRRFMKKEKDDHPLAVVPKHLDQIVVGGGAVVPGVSDCGNLSTLFHYGQMAGVIASLSVGLRQSIHEIPYRSMQEALEREGLIGTTTHFQNVNKS